MYVVNKVVISKHIFDVKLEYPKNIFLQLPNQSENIRIEIGKENNEKGKRKGNK